MRFVLNVAVEVTDEKVFPLVFSLVAWFRQLLN